MNYKRKPQIVVSKDSNVRASAPVKSNSNIKKQKNRASLPIDENPNQQSGFVGDDEVTETMSIGEETVGGINEVQSYLSRNAPI